MIYLVAAETVVLVLMAMLVAGLLRSHAEILRRLPAEGEAAGTAGSYEDLQIAGPPSREEGALPAFDVSGPTLEGDALKVGLTSEASPATLVAFLSSGCATCLGFWEAMQPGERQPLPGGARLTVVTKDSSHESPSKLRELAPPDVPVVMSSEAWEQYSVPIAPYFVYVAGGQILGEGAAADWSQIVSLFRDAVFDLSQTDAGSPQHEAGRGAGGRRSAADRMRSEDQVLASAGVASGHPSLYHHDPADAERD